MMTHVGMLKPIGLTFSDWTLRLMPNDPVYKLCRSDPAFGSSERLDSETATAKISAIARAHGILWPRVQT